MGVEPIPGNNDPHRVHGAEQMWAAADAHLRKVIEYAHTVMPDVYAKAGGNTDISVVYDWWKAYIQAAEEVGENLSNMLGLNHNGAHDMTVLMCAAAITKLMASEETMRVSTVLTQLERDINDDDH